MKIRSQEELLDLLADEKRMRKQEMISLRKKVGYEKGSRAEFINRTSVVLAYSHLEGFVKYSGRAYVYYVTHKTRQLSRLQKNFQALACRQELSRAEQASKKIEPHLDIVSLFTERYKESLRIDPEKAVDTESNLNEEVFKNICQSLGLQFYGKWESKAKFMNDLFHNRCQIAHGELYTPPEKYAKESLEFVVSAIDDFGTEIENAALQEKFLRE